MEMFPWFSSFFNETRYRKILVLSSAYTRYAVSTHVVLAGRLSVKALAGPCRTEPTIAPEVGIRRITVFGTGFYH